MIPDDRIVVHIREVARDSCVPAGIAPAPAHWAHEMGTENGLDLMRALQQVADPRRPSNGTRHDFQEILVKHGQHFLPGLPWP